MPDIRVQTFSGGAFGQNSYLVSCGAEGVLVDAGAAAPAALRAAGRDGVSISAIVLTHAHLDHVEGVAHAKELTGAPVYLHPDDRTWYNNAQVQAQQFGLRLEPPPAPDRELVHGGTLEVGASQLEVRHTPGHTPGHVILVGKGFALVADCVFAGSIGRTDLPGGDLPTLMRSIREEILTLPGDTVLYPGHGPETTVHREMVSNPFLVGDFGGARLA
ncbi:MAG: MBL fold metallo-hydrolase [Longimicrobiaceae bacterium]